MEHVRDHADRAEFRLLEQFKRKPRIAALVATFGRQVQALEDALWQLFTERGVDNAVGAQLDVLGTIVQAERGGLTDELYRKHIRARVVFNRSNGTAPELLEVFRLILPATVTLRINEDPNAAFRLVVAGAAVEASDPGVMRAFLARPAGVRGIVQYSLAAPAATFTLDSGPGLDAGKLAGDFD